MADTERQSITVNDEPIELVEFIVPHGTRFVPSGMPVYLRIGDKLVLAGQERQQELQVCPPQRDQK
jgi:hypothetical protein